MSAINWFQARKKKRPLGCFTRQQGSYKGAQSIVYHSGNRKVPDNWPLAKEIDQKPSDSRTKARKWVSVEYKWRQEEVACVCVCVLLGGQWRHGKDKVNERNRQEKKVCTLWKILDIRRRSERKTNWLSKGKMTTSSVACRLFKQSLADPVGNRLLWLHHSNRSIHMWCSTSGRDNAVASVLFDGSESLVEKFSRHRRKNNNKKRLTDSLGFFRIQLDDSELYYLEFFCQFYNHFYLVPQFALPNRMRS